MSWRDRPYSGGHTSGMGEGPRFADHPMSWTPTLGTVFGIRVQVHILFLIFIAIELLRSSIGGGFWWSLRYQLMLFGLVFLHEMGHCFGARYVGGSANRILMWPLGGLAYVAPPHRPGAQLFTTAAGPSVNLLCCLLSALALIAGTGTLHAVSWNPFASYPHESIIPFFRSDLFLLGYQFFYVNYLLVLFNVCLPVFPLDGGRMFQSLCWYWMGYERSMRLATTVGMVGAVVLGCFGLLVLNFLLIGIAVFAYIMSMQERRMAEAYGGQVYDLSAAYDEPKQRKRRFRQGAWARKQKKLAEEQAEVDRILAKVHDQGIQSLTRSEKKILSRATQKQRERDREAGRLDRL